jgi:hypothetical protein
MLILVSFVMLWSKVSMKLTDAAPEPDSLLLMDIRAENVSWNIWRSHDPHNPPF